MNRLVKLWSLSLVMNKTGIQPQIGRRRDGKVKRSASAIVFASISLLLVSFMFGFTQYLGLTALKDSPELSGVLESNGITFLSIVFALSVVFITQFMFLSKDNDVFLSMPFTYGDIYIGRMTSSLLNIYVIELLFLIPYFVAFDLVFTPNWSAYVGQLLLFLVIPIIISTIIFLLFIFVGTIIKIQKRRRVGNRIFLTLSIILAAAAILMFAFGMGVSNIGLEGGAAGQEEFDNILGMSLNSTNWLTWIRYPFAVSTSGGLSHNLPIWHGILYTLGFIAVAGLLVVISYFVARKYYGQIIVGSSDGLSKRSKKKLDQEIKKEKSSSVFGALLKRETRTVFRSGAFFSQLVLPYLIVFPLILVSLLLPFIVGDGSMSFGEIHQFMDELGARGQGFVSLIIISFVTTFSGLVGISSTAVSREGPNAYLMKVMPVALRTQIYAKMALGVIVAGSFGVISATLLGLLIGLNWAYILLIIVGTILITVLINYLMLLVDLKRPMLHWREEIIAVKQNLNTLIGIGIAFLFGIIFIASGFMVLYLAVEPWIYVLVGVLLIVIIPLGAILLTDYLTFKQEGKLLANIQ